jgi:hypothetical protein
VVLVLSFSFFFRAFVGVSGRCFAVWHGMLRAKSSFSYALKRRAPAAGRKTVFVLMLWIGNLEELTRGAGSMLVLIP